MDESTGVGQIKQLFAEMAAAERQGDPARWEQLWHPDAWELAPEAPFARGLDAICFGLTERFRDWTEDVRIQCEELDELSERWAIACGTLSRRSHRKDRSVTEYFDGKFLAILTRDADLRWKLYRFCFNSSVPGARS